jgi:putative ABC transport system permease protein
MVLLPVAAVVAGDTLLRTGEIDVVEGLPRSLGDAQARVDAGPYAGAVRQSPDLRRSEAPAQPAGAPQESTLDEAALRELLPAGSRLLAVREDWTTRGVRTPDGQVARAVFVAADLQDADARGPWQVLTGRAPSADDEVAVTAQLAGRGFSAGATLLLPDGSERTVTGTVASPHDVGSESTVVGLPEALGQVEREPTRWYVSGPEVTWDDVLEVNALGGYVLSRSVVLDPPPDELVPELQSYDQLATTAAIVGLVVVMAVLEVVLLAGPAFAVGARRQRRALALLAASGGEPRHVRRVVLAQGLLVGLLAAVLGVPLGLAVAAGARAPLTRFTDAEWGPYDVSVRDVLLFALLGVGTAVLAAVVPAVLAARQPVVASLHGRRPPPVRAAWPTLAGLVLLAVGAAACVLALGRTSAELGIAFAALPTVLGAVLLAPALLALLGRAAGRLPLSLRYAVRDADRQRSRTAPAVAAITATVAAAVALGVSSSSDAAEARATYTPSGPPGAAVVLRPGPSGPAASIPAQWTTLEQAVREALPGEPITAVRGLQLGGDTEQSFEDVQVCQPGSLPTAPCPQVVGGYGSSLGAGVLVGPSALEALAPLVEPSSLPAARQALAAGGAAVFGAPSGQLELRRQRTAVSQDGASDGYRLLARAAVAATAVRAADGQPPAQAVVTEQVASQLGGASTVALVVGSDVSRAEQDRLVDALSVVDPSASVSVERGFDDDSRLVVLVLGLVAFGLVLAGTLAATSLALVEAKPDLVTLSEVGARPRTRRSIAGSYAAVLALSGTVLGIAAGLVPGIAAAVALTRYGAVSGWTSFGPADDVDSTRYVVVPWELVLGLLVVLPLVAASVAALSAGGRRSAPTRRRTA